jgi:hypothetical protein
MVDPVHNIKKKFVNFNKWDKGLLASRSAHCFTALRCKVAVHRLWKNHDFPECSTRLRSTNFDVTLDRCVVRLRAVASEERQLTDISSVMENFCSAGAQAVQRYVEVSGIDPNDMPEYFMPAFILNRLMTKITTTLETSFGRLVEWNKGARERQGLSPDVLHNDDRLLRFAQQVDGRRVDMVIFQGEEERKPKDEQDFLALVEFKRFYIDASRIPGRISDRDKLLMLLEHIDTCPWGIVCGWFNPDHREWQKGVDIKGTKDCWYESIIRLPPDRFTTPLFFGARLFARSSDEPRLRELVGSASPEFPGA